jgi:MFS family permease
VLTEGTPYPGLRQTWWPMLLLFLAANIFSIDKAIVGVLAEPIRTDFGITDVQMSLLLGLAYNLLSGIFGLFLGTLVDRQVRRTLLACSIILWSLSTVAGGLAPNFHWFFLFRGLVGLGEACVAPAALSLIADMFPPHQRGRALGGYLIGATIGTALSSIIPGAIVGANLHLMVPGFGLLVPWRSAFLICGMMGPIIGLLFFTVREPVRRGLSLVAPTDTTRKTTILKKLAFLSKRRATIVPLFAGFCFFYIAFVGIASWTAPFVTRTYGLSLASFANIMGLILLIGGGTGYIFGGFVADSALGQRRGGRLKIMIMLPLIALPGAFAGFAPTATFALVQLAFISLTTPMLNVAMNASVQELVPNDMRGFSYALLSVVSALPAGAGGPLAIAYVTQDILGNPGKIGLSFLIVGLPALLASSLCFMLARRAYLSATH